MAVLTCTVPVPPSVNNAYATIRGRRVLSKDGRSFKDTAGWLVRAAAIEQGWSGGERFVLSLRLYFRTNQRRDISNTVKIVEDCLAETLGFDDCRVDKLLVIRAGIDRTNPRCEVKLESMA